MKQFFKNIFQSDSVEQGKARKPSKKTGYLMIIGLVGLLLLIMGNAFSDPPDTDDDVQYPKPSTDSPDAQSQSNSTNTNTMTSNISELEKSYEHDLKNLLEEIDGVSNVKVMVNLDSTDIKVYEQNLVTGQQTTQEEDTNGGTRLVEDRTEDTQTVLVRKGDQEVPLLVQTKKPEVRGVLVVANGVDHASVKQWVVQSVSRVLDVPTHRVSVLPKK
ncbi:stage III sporulation protein AG [Lentibacillus saliphilus]|uniref:stage III sporulation protein AG n=1 Tax=Lentibacillus saliphilus TaxID=2737028 RepID=UPI001FE37586|nr:stage III sporulation protein AG [Lentibacillus saliphilus]